ncbi:hypothetical protein ASPFODRAFT_584487 [Aspergillus luchuensis CBS 106.47]|uniref:Uncharacterized protein n=1 Tax=Aspergillus luchuensis (strain CBS 106.47) TaxID=1137211 RepID=A0A1M3TM01_ASPLC|nr:hypothetical protein ASPFODRAFT_584487 [Aspergillus luchuensis CBS 106.47]
MERKKKARNPERPASQFYGLVVTVLGSVVLRSRDLRGGSVGFLLSWVFSYFSRQENIQMLSVICLSHYQPVYSYQPNYKSPGMILCEGRV